MLPSVPKANTIESAFRPAFEEISRRSSVASNADKNDAVTYFERSADATRLPFELPDQKVVLLSIGTSVLAPRPVDPCRPALRVYGAFACREDAMEHSEVIRNMDPECSLLILNRDKWFMFPQTEKMRDNKEAAEARMEQKLLAHRTKQAEESSEFDKAVKERAERPASSAPSPDAEDAEDTREAEAMVYKPPRRLRAGGEVRGQSVVAMCVIRDEFGECLIRILGCFESTTESDNWVRNVATRHVTEDDVCVAPTCEWIYPNGVSTTTSSMRYRVDELQRIMDAAERNPEAVRSYKEWKKEQDERSKQIDEELLEEQRGGESESSSDPPSEAR